MKKGFVFERNLPHQTRAVESIIKVFENLPIKTPTGTFSNFINPTLDNKEGFEIYKKNIERLQQENNIAFNVKPTFSNIIDIMMETGTGKTYTYTKTIFELNRHYGIFKFILLVPTLAIKAGVKNFLKSDSAREHFKEQYGKTITLHIVESQKGARNKKNHIPTSISDFVRADKNDKNSIHVLLINAGMLNSDTMKKDFDRTLFDKYTKPIEALEVTNSFVIIDEPHRFAQENKTWQNIQLLKPQYIIRFGATFPEKEIIIKNSLGKKEKVKMKDYQNLIYTLTAVDAFNQNLVKGVIAYIEEFEEGKNVFVRLINTDWKEATFELDDNGKKSIRKLIRGDNLKQMHEALDGWIIEKIRKNPSEVVFSNGVLLTKGDRINPYSYAETLQERMIRKAIKNHFKIERELLTQTPRIKPLTLFFIHSIEQYRRKDGYLRRILEEEVRAIAKKYLEQETNDFYKKYLEKTIKNIERTHGGYFSEDNTSKDEMIEKEINEILHDKEALLDLENPRRFIFSKWTLREGWDNPNVFQIVKLRSSGSEISKLQEVGRGLRLPVNEFMSRVKDRQFYLNYYVDFTESDFVDRLIKEINEKSHAISREIAPKKLTDRMIERILEHYSDKFKSEDELLEFLDKKGIITRSNAFKEGGFDYIKQHFPLIFDGVDSSKIRNEKQKKKKVRVRTGKYNELKELWEELNQKAILVYKIENEDEFKQLFSTFMKEMINKITNSPIRDKKVEVKIKDGEAVLQAEYLTGSLEIIPVVTMSYHRFLKELAKAMKANPKTLHEVFRKLRKEFDINNFLNMITVRTIRQQFDNFMLYKSIDKFGIAYQKISHTVHPTKLTDAKGKPLKELDSSDIGIFYSEEKVADSYYFEDLFYDSELEKENMITNIEEVIVFTKIPKNSIKIPIAGGGSYSPDFAYVLKTKDGEKRLYFVVETKNVGSKDELRKEELQKIRHAQRFFENLGNKVRFEAQFSNKKIVDLIKEILYDT